MPNDPAGPDTLPELVTVADDAATIADSAAFSNAVHAARQRYGEEPGADTISALPTAELVGETYETARDTGGAFGSQTVTRRPPPYASADVLFTLARRYDVVAELGRGGMGVVYKAWAIELGRWVAIKLIRSTQASEVARQRFINEAMLAARLAHPNIVRIFDAGESADGEPYFVMEFIEGGDLGSALRSGLVPSVGDQPLVDGRLTARGALIVLESSARALEYAHQQGIVHRDIKPDNVMVDGRGEPHLTDFGIAKSMLEDEAPGLTAAGAPLGSPQYMSPEQANGEVRAVGPRTDVYSLGATLYYVLCGRPPFIGDSVIEVIGQVLLDEPERPSQVARAAGRVPPPVDLETICLKSMEKQQSQRYAAAGEVADELRRYLDGEPIRARPVGPLERLRKRLRRSRGLLALAGVAAAVVVTLAVAFTVTVLYTMNRSSDTLRDLDATRARGLAATLERAIRVNMLQGRADLARELVTRLGSEEAVGRIRVFRTDRTPAYLDPRTRRRVEQHLARPGVLEDARRRFPELAAQIEVLREVAFSNIDAQSAQLGDDARVPDEQWRRVIDSAEVLTYIEGSDTSGQLVVLQPIENSPKCQVCHGSSDDGEYVDNSVRAVMVVRRPLGRVGELIESNERATATIAAVTVLVLLLLAFVLTRVFGIGLARREFGQ